MNPWTGTDLLVPEAVRGTVEPADVETLRLRAGWVAGDDDAIALLQGLVRHADLDKLRAVVHLEPPLLSAADARFDVHHHERMWIDELKLRDDAFEGHLLVGVVKAHNRMMCMDRHD